MARDERETKARLSESQQAEVDYLNRLDELARQAWQTPWWRNLVKMCMDRRTAFLNELVSLNQPPLDEAIIKGRIQELTIIIQLDANCKRLVEEVRTEEKANAS